MKASGEYVLCEHCQGILGRLNYAERARGEGANQENNSDPAPCQLCGGLFSAPEVERLSSLVEKKLSGYDYSTFLIGVRVGSDIENNVSRMIDAVAGAKKAPLGAQPTVTEPAKSAATDAASAEAQKRLLDAIRSALKREIGLNLEKSTGKAVDFNNPEITAVVDTRYDSVELQIAALFIYGRYRKLVRGIPQTRWDCKVCRGTGCPKCDNTGKMYQDSVQGYVARPALALTGGTGEAFHGMGREDIDARMLGDGRPFILEVLNPKKRAIDLSALEASINSDPGASGKIDVSALRFAKRPDVEAIKNAKPDKAYRVTVEFGGPVNADAAKKVVEALKGQVISQYTPQRVEHRRASLYRKRKIADIRMESLDAANRTASIYVRSESGTYIKEFANGDSGRTKPSISSELGVECKVLELDVVKIYDGE